MLWEPSWGPTCTQTVNRHRLCALKLPCKSQAQTCPGSAAQETKGLWHPQEDIYLAVAATYRLSAPCPTRHQCPPSPEFLGVTCLVSILVLDSICDPHMVVRGYCYIVYQDLSGSHLGRSPLWEGTRESLCVLPFPFAEISAHWFGGCSHGLSLR